MPGLYTVLYDTNSYAGPVASFLGCSPYQYAMRSSNLGFAGRGVIKETTGIDIEPHYHSAYKALARGHIQGVWDRREARANLKQVPADDGRPQPSLPLTAVGLRGRGFPVPRLSLCKKRVNSMLDVTSLLEEIKASLLRNRKSSLRIPAW